VSTVDESPASAVDQPPASSGVKSTGSAAEGVPFTPEDGGDSGDNDSDSERGDNGGRAAAGGQARAKGEASPVFRRTDRTDAPLYLSRYTARAAEGRAQHSGTTQTPTADDDASTPLYLRRFRARPTAQSSPSRAAVLEVDGERFTSNYAEATRSHEIAPPPERRPIDEYVSEIRIIRHGITQGYSTDAGLTPMGGWQAHQRGHSLAKTLRAWPKMRIVCADTNRARQTAEQIHRGLLDGMDQFGRDAVIEGPEAIGELRNFQVWTPDGPRDITSAFRQYQALMEKLERMAVGDRPRWLVEIDRFYRTQLGGQDPIQTWLTIPLMYFESPQACVRRFWRGFNRLIEESPNTRIIAATHSGPIRAFATWAHGYDPGEPHNVEEVIVRIRKGGRTALVGYRNRVTEVNVPDPADMPVWDGS
jgi:broad specificity phosphatase PhoE